MFQTVFKVLALCALVEASGMKNATNVGEFLSQRLEALENATNKLSLNDIRLENPTSVSYNNNAGPVILFKPYHGTNFVLKGNELLTVEADDRVQLSPLVILQLPAEQVLEMSVGDWEGMLVVVLRFPTSLHVYVTKKHQSGLRTLEAVQKIKISSSADRIVLLKSDNELFLVTQVAKNNVAELSCYKWETSFFSRKTQDIIDFPSRNDLFGVDDVLNGPLVLSIGYGNTTQVIAFQLDPQAGRLTKLQSLHFKRSFAEHYVLNRRLFLIACSTETFCAVYKWNGGQFRRHFKISIQVLEKIARIEYQQDFVILHNHDGSLQLFATENIVQSEQGLLVKGANAKSEYAICRKESNNPQSYFVEFTTKDSTLAVTSREISVFEILRESQSGRPDARNCSRELKSYLKQRIPQVQASHQLALNVAQQDAKIQKSAIKTINSKHTSLSNSNIKRISMPYNVGSTVVSLRDRIAAVEASIVRAHAVLKNSQSMGRASDEGVQGLTNIVVKNLQHTSADNLSKGLLLKTQPQLILSEQNKFRNASASKVVMEESVINSIPVKHLLNATSTKALRGEKILEHIELHKIDGPLTLNNVNVSLFKSAVNFKEMLPNEYVFKGQVNLRNLHLSVLNGFDFNSFIENVHLLNERTHLRGNCFINSGLSANALTVKQIMDLPVADLLTTSTDQVVAADCFVSTFFTSKVTTQSLNNENIRETVALADSINFVEVPTRMNSAHISKNLNILDEQVALPQTIENLRNHIIGTRTSDLAQIYSGIVRVEGSLRIKSLARATQKTNFVLNDRRVPPQIKSNFWTLEGKQEILNPNFVVQAGQLTTGNVVTSFLSQWPANEFLSASFNGSQGHLRVRFEEAFVEGNVDGFSNNIPSLIFHTARECVPLKGPATQIRSSIVFQDKQLSVRQLNAERDRDSSWRSLVQKENAGVHFKNRLHVKKLKTASLLVDKDLKTLKFNNVKLQSQLSAAISIGASIDLNSLKIQTFGCGTLSTKFFESHSFEVFMQNMKSQLENTGSSFVNSVSLQSTEFKTDVIAQTFNEKHDLGNLIATLALKNDISLSCGGNLVFANGITVKKNLETRLLNGFAASDFVQNSLSRYEKQTVASECFCETLETKKLSAKTYNNIAFNQFVSKRETTLSLKANLRTAELSTSNLDSKYSVLTVNKLKEALKYPECSTLQLVKASNGVTAINNKSSYLERIVKFAVFKVGQPQIIAGKLHSADTRVEIVSLVKLDAIFYANTRFVSFYELFGDSLKNGTRGLQKFSGLTTLLSPAYCKNAVIKDLAFYSSRDINNVIVASLNSTIARPQTTISSAKKFVKLRGKLLSLQTSPTFVHPLSLVPAELSFNNLETAFLRTYTIHKLSLNYFLENRLQLNGNAEQDVVWPLAVQSLTVLPDCVLSSINSVFVNDAVFSRNDQLQEIKGHKILNGKLSLQGPSTIKVVNNLDFTDFLKNRILRSRDFRKRNLVISKANLPAGASFESNVNGQKIEMLLSDGSKIQRTHALLPPLHAMRNRESQLSYTKRSKARRLLYIDNNKAIQFSRNDSREAGCLKSDVKVSPSKFNEVDITFNSDESMFDMTALRIILRTPKALCKTDESRRHEEGKLSVEWFDRKNSEAKFNTTIVLPGSLRDADIVETQNETILMLATVMQKQAFSISVYQLDTNCNEWKITQPDLSFNRVFTSHFIDTWTHQFLAVSSADEASPSEKCRVTIFMLNQTSNSFSACQHWSLDVKADIMLSIVVQPTSAAGDPKVFLILAEDHSKVIYIYQFSKQSKEFAFHQKLNFESAITHIAVIDIADFSHFIVSLQNGQFCLYQFRGIESWKMKQCGQFPKVDVIRSYEYFKRQHLFLMSEKRNAATALSVYRQGDLI